MPTNNLNLKPPLKKYPKTKPKDFRGILIIGLNFFLLFLNILILSFLPKQADTNIVKRSEILAQELQVQSAQKIISDLKATEADKQIIYASLPEKNSPLEVIKYIESLDNYVSIQSYRFESEEPVKDANGFLYLPISLVLEGDLSQAITALQQLEQAPYLFRVTQTLIESPHGLSGTIIVRLNLQLYIR